MSGTAPHAIEAHDVRKAFGETQALAGVDLTAETRRILALLGPNGAGKTTLVRILTTLLVRIRLSPFPPISRPVRSSRVFRSRPARAGRDSAPAWRRGAIPGAKAGNTCRSQPDTHHAASG